MTEPRLDWDRSERRFRVEGLLCGGTFTFRARLRYRRSEGGEPLQIEARPEEEASAGLGSVELVLGWERVGDGLELRPRIPKGHPGFWLDRVELMEIEGLLPGFEDPAKVAIFQHGFQSWSGCHVTSGQAVQRYPWIASFALMNHNVDSPFWGRRDGLISSLFTLLRPPSSSEALLIGFTSQRSGLGEVFVRTRKGAGILCNLDMGGRRVEGGEDLVLDGLRLAFGEPGSIRDAWAERLSLEMGARKLRAPLAGWCTWYEFYAKVKPEQVRANLERICGLGRLGLQVVQLDDGYQAAVGDWLQWSKRFPEGVAPLMQEIDKAGFKAGIWLAPFMTTRDSALAKAHPEWLLKDSKGRPVDCGFNPVWMSRACALDLTHPEVLEYLESVFRRLREYGIQHFKLDFLFAGARSGRHHRPGLSPVEIYREALGRIRAVVGEESTLLGCGAPIGPSIGCFEAMRVSEDVKEEWHSSIASFFGRGCGFPSARGSIANNLHRAFMHDRLWSNDPDGLIVREHDSRLARDEVETHATTLSMTGGLVFLNDDLTRLENDRLKILEGLLPPCPKAARLQRWLDTDLPSLFEMEGDALRGVAGGQALARRLLAFLNLGEGWEERPLPQEVSGGSFFDFWREQTVLVHRPGSSMARDPRVVVPPRSVRALLWTPWLGRPAVVGSSFNLTALVDGRMREHFSAEVGAGLEILRVECDALARSSGRLWLSVPARYALAVDRLPKGVSVQDLQPARVTLEVHLAPPWSIELLFHTIGPPEIVASGGR